ncbi:MAG: enoyl-CoA hydratase/isomerase family protein [Planctomycetota bacterium]|nr:enoyl-CoA hydratase/isomerase family protein [Planctomycetota bacterium]
MAIVNQQFADDVTTITLNNPEMRNALSIEMFDAIEHSLGELNQKTRVVLLQGAGDVFCSGFDMKACTNDIALLETFILRLSGLIKKLKHLKQPVVVSAHGAAIAGGCAMLTACDFIVGSLDGKYGYPVHLLGITPAVTIPTLFQRVGEGKGRALLMSGQILHGRDAVGIGLLTHAAKDDGGAKELARQLAEELAKKPPRAMQVTKQWLNELDGSFCDKVFDTVARETAITATDETQERLKRQWGS